jgi:hypothetical protein
MDEGKKMEKKSVYVCSTVFTVLFSLVVSAPVFAGSLKTETNAGRIRAEETMDELNSDVENLASFEQAIDQVLDAAALGLQEKGFNQEAEKIKGDWKNLSNIYFHGPQGFLKLGDHTPLNQWLADVYNIVEGSLGQERCASTHLEDIKNINFGFPVVIHPKGDPATGLAWGMAEYGEHFVPFATAVSFWTGKVVCKRFVKSVASSICSNSLEKFRSVVGEYVAPRISDEIYSRFNPATPVPFKN